MLLKVGSKGDDVKKLQAKLGTAADGAFGPGTLKAAMAYSELLETSPNGPLQLAKSPRIPSFAAATGKQRNTIPLVAY